MSIKIRRGCSWNKSCYYKKSFPSIEGKEPINICQKEILTCAYIGKEIREGVDVTERVFE